MSPMAATTPIAGPPPRFLIGNLSEFNRDQLGSMMRWSRDYGAVVPLRFGPLPAYLVTDPALVEQVLVDEHRSFRKPAAVRRLGPVVGRGIFSSDGDFWRRQRRLVQPAFHHDRIRTYGSVMVRYAEEMAAGWQDGEVRDIHAEMTGLTLRIVAKALFDAEVVSDVATVGAALATTSAHLQTRLDSLLFFLPDRVPTPGNRRMWRAIRSIDEVIERVVAERRASGKDRGDLLSMLLAARDETGQPMPERQLRDELMTIMVAGHETTAVTLSWAWYLLSQHPETEAALSVELDRVLAGRAPGTDDYAQLIWAEHVIYEVLRLYPPAYGIGREAIVDVELGGHRVRKGSVVLTSPWAMHRDPRWFDEPDAFQPERWADGLARRLRRGVYFPFGAGPRQCVGAGFAMIEAVLVLAAVARRWRLRLEPGQSVEPIAAVALRPSGPIRMRLEQRPAT